MKEKINKKAPSNSIQAIKSSGKKDDSFYEQVYEVVRQIPKGRVTSYGAIAKALGSGKSARIVGWAMNNAHFVKPKVPAHRVVNSLGLLTGKHAFETPTLMQELLEKEGIHILNEKVVDFTVKFWNPADELL